MDRRTRSGMARSLKLSALVSLVAFAGTAAAVLWRPRSR
jgi:hypothetical protein